MASRGGSPVRAYGDHGRELQENGRYGDMPLLPSNSLSSSPLSSPGSTPREKRIRVCVRMRPFTKNESVKAGGKAAWTWHGNSIYQQIFPAQAPSRKPRTTSTSSSTTATSDDKPPAANGENAHSPSSYAFDALYGPTAHTSQLYDETVRDSIAAAVDGYHSSVFVYGQTGTGKTHTMLGTRAEPGLIQLAVDDIFAFISHHADSEFLLRFSYLEIYNERVYDLLADGARTEIKIYEIAKQDPEFFPASGEPDDKYFCNDVLIKGLTEEIVVSPDHVLSLVASGNFHRHTASTEANDQSSRSHTIFRLVIESQTKSDSAAAGSVLRSATLNLVDLAGSESVRLANTTGAALEEGRYINRSLLTLGHIIWKLSRSSKSASSTSGQQQQHLPYRNSKLTRILQPALGGRAQITIVCTIAPSVECLAETHSTLKFATRARRVKSRLAKSENAGESALLKKYRNRIKVLQTEWEELEIHKTHDGATAAPRLTREQLAVVEARQRELQFAIENINRVILNSSHRHGEDVGGAGARGEESSNNGEEEGEADDEEEVGDEDDEDDDEDQEEENNQKEEELSGLFARQYPFMGESVEPESEGSVRTNNLTSLSTDSTLSAQSSVASRRRGSLTTALKIKYMEELHQLDSKSERAELLREMVRGLEIAEAEHDTRLSQIRELEVENRHLREQLRHFSGGPKQI